MRSDDIDIIGTVVAAAVKQATEPLLARIAVLEAREPIHGKDGAAGAAGADGPQGPQGIAGEPGPMGPQGERGLPGERGADGLVGAQGPAGERGLQGERGLDGMHGRDGLPGQPGRDGERGEKGLDGKDGRDGLDGLGFDDLEIAYDGARSFTMTYRQGERTKSFPFVLPIPIFQGVFVEGTAYQKHDCVQFGGHIWIAKTDTVLKPTDTGQTKDWVLMVRRGRDGKEGPQGAPGENGKDGKPWRP